MARYGDTPEQLLQELRAGRLAEAIDRLHGVRGIVGTIGGTDSSAAGELERALRASASCADATLKAPLGVFIACHEELVASIGAVLSRQPVAKPTAGEGSLGTEADLRPLLARLRAALANDEPKPCQETLATLRQHRWPGVPDTVLVELDGLVRRYRFADALAVLDAGLGAAGDGTEEPARE